MISTGTCDMFALHGKVYTGMYATNIIMQESPKWTDQRYMQLQSYVYVPMHTYACTYVQLVAAVKLAIL